MKNSCSKMDSFSKKTTIKQHPRNAAREKTLLYVPNNINKAKKAEITHLTLLLAIFITTGTPAFCLIQSCFFEQIVYIVKMLVRNISQIIYIFFSEIFSLTEYKSEYSANFAYWNQKLIFFYNRVLNL